MEDREWLAKYASFLRASSPGTRAEHDVGNWDTHSFQSTVPPAVHEDILHGPTASEAPQGPISKSEESTVAFSLRRGASVGYSDVNSEVESSSDAATSASASAVQSQSPGPVPGIQPQLMGARDIPEIVKNNADLKLYDCIGGATRRVRIFLLESGLGWILEYCTVPVDQFGRENRTEAFLEKTPSGTLPVLQTHSCHVTESTAICSYLEDRFHISGTARSLYGATAEERAVTNSWVQKLLWYIADPLEVMTRCHENFRDFYMNRTFQYSGMNDQLQERAKWGIEWLEASLHRRFKKFPHMIETDWYICEYNRFSMADIVLVAHIDCYIMFLETPILDSCPLLNRLLTRLRLRPSSEPSCLMNNTNLKA